jgi:hypothetical protein
MLSTRNARRLLLYSYMVSWPRPMCRCNHVRTQGRGPGLATGLLATLVDSESAQAARPSSTIGTVEKPPVGAPTVVRFDPTGVAG